MQIYLRRIVGISTAVTVVIWGAMISILEYSPFSLNALRPIPGIITAVGLFWAFYLQWGWKIPYLRKIAYIPNFGGTWLGCFKSDWKDASGQGVPVSKFVLVVRQYWAVVSVTAFTEKQHSRSYAEAIFHDDTRGSTVLAYLYSGQRTSAGDHGVQQGAAELYLEDGKKKFLRGNFWTIARSTGFLRVQYCSEDFAASFGDAVDKWPAARWASL